MPDAYGTVGLLTRTGAPKAAKKAWEQLLLPTPLPPPAPKPLSEAGSTGTLSRGFGTLRRKNTISTSFETPRFHGALLLTVSTCPPLVVPIPTMQRPRPSRPRMRRPI